MKLHSNNWASAILLLSLTIGGSWTKGQKVVTDPRQHLAQILLSQLLEQRQQGLSQPRATDIQPVYVDQQLAASSPRVDRSPLTALQQQLLRGRSIGSGPEVGQQNVVVTPVVEESKSAATPGGGKEEHNPDAALDKLLKKRANVEERRSKLKSNASFKSAVLSQIESSEEIRRRDEANSGTCENCVDGSEPDLKARWTMPLNDMGHKKYYLGIFFKANWYKANQFCRYHGMHLASIASEEENKHLETLINSQGLGLEHFWTSGTDQGEEGTFFWLSTGRPVTYTNWNAGEPNNFVYENGEEEHCLELWNRDGKGLKWNDTPCSFETYFICEVAS